MKHPLFLFIILSQIFNAYGMDINDDLESIDLDSEIEAHAPSNRDDIFNATGLFDGDDWLANDGHSFWDIIHDWERTAQNDQDNASTDNTVRTVPWKTLLSQYNLFDHSPAKRAIVLKIIKDLDTSLLFYNLPYRSPSSLSRESEPDLVTRKLIQLIQDICLHEPEHDEETVYSDQGRALFLGKSRRKSLPHSLKPEYNARNNSTASTSSSN